MRPYSTGALQALLLVPLLIPRAAHGQEDAWSEAEPACTAESLAPGMSHLGWGIDPVAWAKTAPILSCTSPQAAPKVLGPGGQLVSYQLPGWASLTPTEAHQSTISASLVTTGYQVARGYGAQVGIQNSGPLRQVAQLTGTASLGAKLTRAITSEGLKAQVAAEQRVALYELSIRPDLAPTASLAPGLLEAVQSVLASDDLDLWDRKLFSRYGSHVVYSATVGGSYVYSATVDHSSRTETISNSLQLNLSAALLGGAAVGTLSRDPNHGGEDCLLLRVPVGDSYNGAAPARGGVALWGGGVKQQDPVRIAVCTTTGQVDEYNTRWWSVNRGPKAGRLKGLFGRCTADHIQLPPGVCAVTYRLNGLSWGDYDSPNGWDGNCVGPTCVILESGCGGQTGSTLVSSEGFCAYHLYVQPGWTCKT